MTRKLRTVLVAVMLLGLVAGGLGTAAAQDTDTSVDNNVNTNCGTSVVDDGDLVDVDDTLNDNNVNVLGIGNQESPVLSTL